MTCVICKNGRTEAGLTSVTLERNELTVVFKSVPANICDNCGEGYVDSDVAKELLKSLDALEKNGTQIEIRKFSFV